MKPSPKPETQNDENCAIILFNKSSVSPWQTTSYYLKPLE